TRKSDTQKKRLEFVQKNGGSVSGNTQLEQLYSRDGMHGFSPRFILNAMAIAMVESNMPTVSVKGFYSTLKSLIEDYAILSDYDRLFYVNTLTKIYSSQEEKLNMMTLDDVALSDLKR